ncbi:MAG: AAA family ATPase, partial [Candidatus Riflebacteria bacterium]
LVTAMIRGGICILDEGNRMRDKAWASLAPLLDSRRYVESIITGSRIKAHPDFRIAATMNEDASVYNLPEYIKSRLRPRITVPRPDEKILRSIIEADLPFISPKILDIVISFLKAAENGEKAFSPRQAVQLASLTNKICASDPAADPGAVVAESALAVADFRLKA